MGLLDQADFSVFKQAETWKAFGIAALMFVSISFAAISMFDSMDEVFASDAVSYTHLTLPTLLLV